MPKTEDHFILSTALSEHHLDLQTLSRLSLHVAKGLPGEVDALNSRRRVNSTVACLMRKLKHLVTMIVISMTGARVRYFSLPLLLALIGPSATAQTGFLDRTLFRAGESFRYQVFVPAEYTRNSAWPLIASLHGNGRQGTDGMLQTGTDFAIRVREHRSSFPAIIVFPQARPGTRWFYPEMEELVMAELQRTLSEFRIDTKRIYLHGFSMGATGAYRIALKWPKTFAALILVAGRIEDGPPYTLQEIEIDRGANPFVAAADPFAALATAIKQIPIWIFHGDADERVPVDQSRRVVAALKRSGAAIRYTEYPGIDHNSAPAKAYAEDEFLGWLFSQHR